MDNVIIIDFETTGRSHKTARAIEVCAALVNNGKISAIFSSLIYPCIPIPAGATKINNINDEMVKDKPTFKDILPDLLSFINGRTCVAHNAVYDQGIFNAEMARAGQQGNMEFLCSCRLAKRLLKDTKHSLPVLTQYLQLPLPSDMHAHRAEYDVRVTCELWNHLVDLTRSRLNGKHPDATLLKRLMNVGTKKVDAFFMSISN